MVVKLNKMIIAACVYVCLSITLGSILKDGLIVFLGWNMILASIPYLISLKINTPKKSYIRILGVFIYIIFFPNTMYMMTDFIHLQNYVFFERFANPTNYHLFFEETVVYQKEITNWLVFAHILIGALLSSKLGMSSLSGISKEFKSKMHPYYLFSLFSLSSVAIYIGRFLRFNSWDIFKFWPIIKLLWEDLNFFLQFTVLFLIIHFVIYAVFREKKESFDSQEMNKY